MSFNAEQWARSIRLPRETKGRTSVKATLNTLAWFASERGFECFPSIDTIAEQIEASPTTVRRALATLVDLGLIEIWHTRHRYTDAHGYQRQGRGRNHYVLCLPDDLIVDTSQRFQHLAPPGTLITRVTDASRFFATLSTDEGETIPNPATDSRPNPPAATPRPAINAPAAVVIEHEHATDPSQSQPFNLAGSTVQIDTPTNYPTNYLPHLTEESHQSARERHETVRSGSVHDHPPTPPRANEPAHDQATPSHPLPLKDHEPAPVECDPETDRLIDACLPAEMSMALGPQQRIDIAPAIRARLDAGWSAPELKMRLGANPMGAYSNAFGLIAHRLKTEAPINGSRHARDLAQRDLKRKREAQQLADLEAEANREEATLTPLERAKNVALEAWRQAASPVAFMRTERELTKKGLSPIEVTRTLLNAYPTPATRHALASLKEDA